MAQMLLKRGVWYQTPPKLMRGRSGSSLDLLNILNGGQGSPWGVLSADAVKKRGGLASNPPEIDARALWFLSGFARMVWAHKNSEFLEGFAAKPPLIGNPGGDGAPKG